MHATSERGIDALLADLLCRLRSALGERLVGLYLYGSLVAGDFDGDISDLDLVAAMAAEMSDAEFRALEHMHRDFVAVHPAWEDRIDIVYVSTAALRAFGTQPCRIAVISPGEPFHQKEAEPGWLMNWYFVRQHGVTLSGPPPATIIRPIPAHEFLQTVREHVEGWSVWIHRARMRKSQAYAVLTMCRALHALATGEQASKMQAARWAEQTLPQWSPLIQNALLWRQAWRDDGVDHDATFPETLRFVQFVIRRVTDG